MRDLSNLLWCDLKSNEDRIDFLESGRAFATGIIAEAVAIDVANALRSLVAPTHGNPFVMDRIREIGEYLHCEKPNEAQRQRALEKYFELYDSLRIPGSHKNGEECLGYGCMYCDEEEAEA